MRSVYFDCNATTPLDPGVREAMLPFLGDIFGNPSSVHHAGRKARALLDDARDKVASVWACKPSEVVFTSGGTESSNLAVLGTARHLRAKGRHIICSAIEHHAVLSPCEYLAHNEGFELTILPVNQQGFVDPEAVGRSIRTDTILVSVMAANNETGAIQPVSTIGQICRERGVLFHTDAVQWIGKEPFDTIQQFNADLVSVCAHKFYGPKGAGCLYIRSPLHPDPILLGGSHENERRAGTENLAAIAGFAEATVRFTKTPVFPGIQLTSLTQQLAESLRPLVDVGVALRSPASNRLSNTVAVTVRGCDSLSLLAGLDLEGICASSGSACSSGSLEPSHVMLALGLSLTEAQSLIRFSLGRDSTLEQVQYVTSAFERVVRRVQSAPL